MIRAKNISKKINDTSILNGIDISVNAGEITVIIGQSGSGKTTLLNCLSMLNSPDNGSIELDRDFYEFPNKQEKIRSQFKYNGEQQIGVVFQNINLIPHWTNLENITNPLLRIGNIDEKQLNELTRLFKIDNVINKLPSQCSRGEQQRVAIVRAIMLNPKYLFLDEVTSALDPELIAILFKYLIKLKEQGVGILLITHFLVFAQNVADKIIFIHKGKILEKGSNQIMVSPKTKIFQDFLLSLGDIIINKENIKVSDATEALGIKNDVVQEFVETKDRKNKIRLVYRILDIENISNEIQNNMFEFVTQDFHLFKRDLDYWLQVSDSENEYWDKLSSYIKERLNNPKYPEHKAWIYLLSFKAHKNYKNKSETIKPILEKYLNSQNQINKQVADKMYKDLK